jgi:hypothetical protein
MKSNLVTFARRPFRVRGFRRPTPALLAGLTLMAGTTFVLHAQLTNIEKAVLLSWPEPAQEQIVVGSDSLTGSVWTPWPEPIFKRFGQMCMTVPTTASQQFFKLVPGTQFIDDYSDYILPYTNRCAYSNWTGYGWDYLVTNGTYRIARQGPGIAKWGFAAPLPWVEVRDFTTSVDILDWVASGTNSNSFYLAARGVYWKGVGYEGGLEFNDPGPGTVRLRMICYTNFFEGPSFDFQQYPPPYRLQFSGVGTRMSSRVLSLTTGQILAVMNVTDTNLTQGFATLLPYSPVLNGSESHAITLDNYFVSGTKP